MEAKSINLLGKTDLHIQFEREMRNLRFGAMFLPHLLMFERTHFEVISKKALQPVAQLARMLPKVLGQESLRTPLACF